MKNFFKIFRNIRDRVQPKRKWQVTVSIFEETSGRYVGQCYFTTDARTRREAENRIKDSVRLHVTDAYPIKDKVNGTKR